MGERVLITGGASGIGAAIARRCREDGYETVVLDRVGGDIRVDLSHPEQTETALHKALGGGPIHRLVNNVGAVEVQALEDLTLPALERMWQINVRSALQCAQHLVPGMKERGFGRIVNITSRAALGKSGRTAYSATKAALDGVTRTWALELSPYGVTTNAVAPGPVRTRLFDEANPPGNERTRALLESIPVRRPGEPEDVAQAVSFLLDARSGFTTGQTLYVCGGSSL